MTDDEFAKLIAPGQALSASEKRLIAEQRPELQARAMRGMAETQAEVAEALGFDTCTATFEGDQLTLHFRKGDKVQTKTCTMPPNMVALFAPLTESERHAN